MTERGMTYPPLKEYMADVAATAPGHVLQLNRVGTVTLATVYRGLGDFETIKWDEREFHDGPGELVSFWETLEIAEGFHHALLELLWKSRYGKVMRARTKDMMPAAKEAFAQLR